LTIALPPAPAAVYPPADILVLPPGAPIPVDSLLPRAGLLVADGSMVRSKATHWEAASHRFQQAFHNGWKDGPLLLKLNIKRNFAPP